MSIKPLDDNQIGIGKAIDGATPEKCTIGDIANGAFKGKCPLWTYILAEAMLHKESVKAPVTENITIQTPRLQWAAPLSPKSFWDCYLGIRTRC